jgi:SAM-dependent methyltransferase
MNRTSSASPMLLNCCQVCESQTGSPHIVKEIMLGTGDEFLYWECAECGCLSLTAIPERLERYYPDTYYSMRTRVPKLTRKLRDWIYLSRLSFLVSWRGRSDLDVIRRVGLTKKMSLLDVGCGSGSLLSDLRELGYNAQGVDPFVPGDLRDRFGVRVTCSSLNDVSGKYDVILFRHSLEHMPIHMLRVAAEHLAEGGVCAVCIPLLGWAWKSYKSHWAQLDAPRHFFLHTRKSFAMLAEKSGFQVERVVYDSTEFQFWVSESYQQGIPLNQIAPPTWTQRRRLRRLAASLNSQGQGDMAQFYLRLREGTKSSSATPLAAAAM